MVVLVGTMGGVRAAAAQSAAETPLAANVARSMEGLAGRIAVIGVSTTRQWDRAALHDIVEALQQAGVDAMPLSQPLIATAMGGGETIVQICTRLGAQGLVAVRGSADGTAPPAATIFAANGKALAMVVHGEPPLQAGVLSRPLQLAARNRSWGRPAIAGIGGMAVGLGAGTLLFSFLWWAQSLESLGRCSPASLGCDGSTTTTTTSGDGAGILAAAGGMAIVLGGVAILAGRGGEPTGGTAASGPRLWAKAIAAPGGGLAAIGGRF
jgi:hypothetical protein